MTESDWSTSTAPQAMLAFLWDLCGRGPARKRKPRLFAVACCRQIWPLLADERSRTAVEVAERFADGCVGLAELRDAHRAAQAVVSDGWVDSPTDPRMGYVENDVCEDALSAPSACASASYSGPGDITLVVDECLQAAAHAASPLGPESASQPENIERKTARVAEATTQLALLRCIFGNPFRPVMFLPEWRTEAVVALARGIYEERAWERMPVLADALEDAGCDSREVLEHCRGPHLHHRGCWIVDRVLGKG